MNIIEAFVKSIWGGIYIAIGTLVFLSLYPSPLGAILFSVGLLAIFALKLKLFTGVVAMMNRKYFSGIIFVLFANILGCTMLFLLPQSAAAVEIVGAKVMASPVSMFIRSMLCGIIITSAVLCSQQGHLWLTLIFVPVFILAGFEHSIADICLVISARAFTLSSLRLVLTAILGNSIGSIIFYRSLMFKMRSKNGKDY